MILIDIFAVATDYYQSQQETYRHSFATEEFNTPQQQPAMDDRKQSFASNLVDFLYNLFGANINTPPYTNDYMQYMHPTHLYNEARSSFNLFKMNTTPPQFESNDQPQLQSPQCNPPCNKRRRHCRTGHHYGD